MAKLIKRKMVKGLRDEWILTLSIYGKGSDSERAAYRAYVNAKQNANRREVHQVYKDLGMVRVRGALGGVYYE